MRRDGDKFLEEPPSVAQHDSAEGRATQRSQVGRRPNRAASRMWAGDGFHQRLRSRFMASAAPKSTIPLASHKRPRSRGHHPQAEPTTGLA